MFAPGGIGETRVVFTNLPLPCKGGTPSSTEEKPSSSSPLVQGEIGEIQNEELGEVAVSQDECSGPHSSTGEPEDKVSAAAGVSGETCDPGTNKDVVTATGDREMQGSELEGPIRSGGPPPNSSTGGKPGLASSDPTLEKKEAWVKFGSPVAAAKGQLPESQQQMVEGEQRTHTVAEDKMTVEDIELEDRVAPAAMANIQEKKSPNRDTQVIEVIHLFYYEKFPHHLFYFYVVHTGPSCEPPRFSSIYQQPPCSH